ncbi:GH25 family lysozyme [Pedosphaera parvula]|uniref:Glycoside hydrolase family 25 n=1 Tax=Pedosphaera parvula (strain Ellin514) TaxID=320771 RepID=B9XNZ8_PEDPL|nr:GH25 family lysozyme [Pedosphaera parvula]EEF58464.1 glycoside hydrolase family 25 [Pedosphaera parvula Ellin514]
MKKTIRPSTLQRTALAAASLLLTMGAGSAWARPLGVDVSNNNGSINWTTIKNGGISFAWAKANEGTTFTDGFYSSNISNGKAAGVVMGAYDFARPAANSPTAEANYFWNIVKNTVAADGKTLMPALDFEDFSGHAGASSFSDWANQWCNSIKSKAAANGVSITPVIYTTTGEACSFDGSVAQWGAWIAQPDNGNPQTGNAWEDGGCQPWGSGAWDVWQYHWPSSAGNTLAFMDRDVFNGSSITPLIATSTSEGFDVTLKPSSIVYPGGQEEVFAANSTDGNTWHAWNSGPGTGWTAGYFDAWSMESAVVPVFHSGFMEIFAVGSGGYVNHNYNSGAGTSWNGWSSILAGSFTGNPGAVARPSGYMKVEVHGSDGTITDIYQNGAGQPWGYQSLGGGIASDPTIIINTNGYVQVFATDTSGYLVNRWDTGQGTSWNSGGWTRIGSGSCSGRPCAVVRPDGGVEVFVRNTNKSINHYYHGSFAASWGSDNLGTAGSGFASNAAGMASANGAVEIFVTDSNNNLYHKWNTGTGTAWGNWNLLVQGATSDLRH